MDAPENTTLVYPPGYLDEEHDTEAMPLSPVIENTLKSIETYAREQPWNFALWAVGIGFVLGWKLKIG